MKKKLLVLLFPFFLTGCFFGEVGSGFTTRTCTRETILDDVSLIEQKIIKQRDNNVVSITVINKINGKNNNTFKSLKNSYLSEVNNLKQFNITTNIVDELENEYSVSYEFDFSKISDEIKEKYEFEDLYHNQLKKYENDGYKCK